MVELQNIMRALQSITGALRRHYGTLWGVMEHYGTVVKRYGALQSVMEALWNVTETLESH